MPWPTPLSPPRRRRHEALVKPPANGAAGAPSALQLWAKLLPFIGPLMLFILWDLVVRLGLIKPILLPARRLDTVTTLITGLAGGRCCSTSRCTTVWRTVQAFLIAAVIGVPLGIVLGSNDKIYRSVEFLIDFFRSTPPVGAVPAVPGDVRRGDINKIAIAAFGALLIVSSTAPTA
jgi:sulfonate transport system permease protein